jgi:hypothetical protein
MERPIAKRALYHRAQIGLGLVQAMLVLVQKLMREDLAPDDPAIKESTEDCVAPLLKLKSKYNGRVNTIGAELGLKER